MSNTTKNKKINGKNNTIGIIIYGHCYQRQWISPNYCIYTYDSKYNKFIEKLCDTYHNMKYTYWNNERESEKLFECKIIKTIDLKLIQDTLNAISDNAVLIHKLDECNEDNVIQELSGTKLINYIKNNNSDDTSESDNY
jgi:hypothetical protein